MFATVDAKVLVGLCELVHASLSIVNVSTDVLVHVPAVLHCTLLSHTPFHHISLFASSYGSISMNRAGLYIQSY
jgi:hypothetical protein